MEFLVEQTAVGQAGEAVEGGLGFDAALEAGDHPMEQGQYAQGDDQADKQVQVQRLAQLVQGKTPLLLAKPAVPERSFEVREPRERSERPERTERPVRERVPRDPNAPEVGMKTYRIDVGYQHGVQPGNIVGAIANEADLEARFIGRIDIRDDYTLVDLPDGMPPELLQHMQNVRVASKPLRMKEASAEDIDAPKRKRSFGPPRGDRPGGGPRKPGGFKPRPPR